jgi:hypothetical protein
MFGTLFKLFQRRTKTPFPPCPAGSGQEVGGEPEGRAEEEAKASTRCRGKEDVREDSSFLDRKLLIQISIAFFFIDN